jgi:hypothetical protein
MKNGIRGLMLFVAALLMTHTAYAQSCYQYSGPLFTSVSGVYTTSDHVTATLILTSPITSVISYSNSSPFPAPSFLTMSDGVQTLDTATTPIWSVGIDPADLFIWSAVLQGASTADIDTSAVNAGHGLLFRVDEGYLTTSLTSPFGFEEDDFTPVGTPWILTPDLPSCALAVVKSINADVHMMSIPILGPILSDTLLDVTSNIASLHQYQACEVIRGFDILVRLGEKFDKKNFTATQANALLSASKSLQYVLGCGPGI